MSAILDVELRSLLRDTTAWTTAIALPAGLGALWVWHPPGIGEGAGAVVVLQVVVLLVFSLHSAGTMALAARREQLVLKRWRTSPASDTSIVLGTIGLPAALTLVQATVLTTVTALVLGSRPASAALLAVAVLVAIVTVGALTFVAASVTRSPEHAMITTTPLVAALVGGAVWSLATPPGELGLPGLLVPGAAAAELMQLAWDGAPRDGGWSGLLAASGQAAGASAGLTAVSVVLARRCFRWEPRH